MSGPKTQKHSRSASHQRTKPEPKTDVFKKARNNVEQGGLTRLQKYDEYFSKAAEMYGVPKALLMAVCLKESSAHHSAQRPPAGQPVKEGQQRSYGLMQLEPTTAREMEPGVTEKDLLHPEKNIMIGAKRLAELYKKFGQDWDLALSAYNAGPTRVAHQVKKGYREPLTYTLDYVATVNALKVALEQAQAPKNSPIAATTGWSAYRTA